MSLSTNHSFPPVISARHDATEYIPDLPPSLAVWLMLRTKNVSKIGLAGFDKRCIVCEQFVCNFWTEACDHRVRWLTKEAAKEGLATLTPQPYLRRRLSEDFVERSVLAQQRPSLPLSTKCLSPNPDVSSISAQLAQTQTFVPFQTRNTTEPIPPKYCRWDKSGVHTCSSPTGSCKIAVKILTRGCRHIIGQDCLYRWIIAGKNWCRFCGVVWFKEEKSKITRMALLKECFRGRADYVEHLGAICGKEEFQQLATQCGTVGEGEWKGILTRELERMILGQCGLQKDMDSMKKEILRMDPSFVDTWDELIEDLEKQCCSDAIAPWTVNENSPAPWDPYQNPSARKGIHIPRHKCR